jgi:2-iminobutanoate/2-iminopropanoate deaminase
LHDSTSAVAPRSVATDDAPPAIGPYSQGVICRDARALLFVSGQLPISPRTGAVEHPTDLQAQFRMALENSLAIVKAGGATLSDIVKTTIFLTDLTQYDAFNEVYSELFGEWRPARSVVQVARLPKGATVEVECIVALPDLSDTQRRSQFAGDGPTRELNERAPSRPSDRES